MKYLGRILLAAAVASSLATSAFAQAIGGGGQGGAATTAAQGTPNSAANAWPFFATVGGVAISATNGIYSNLLQGNAVISATNGLYSNILQGNAALSATNPLVTSTFIQPMTGAQGGGLVPQVSGALQITATVIPGNKNLYSAYVISVAGSAGYFVCSNSASGLVSGAITPVDVVPIAAGPSFASIPYSSGPTGAYGSGIACGVTTAANMFTYTPQGTSQFFYHILAN
jgi:hypothetical protein